MPTEITLDENGKITSDSGLFKQLDEWHEKDEYYKIVEAVLSAPLETALRVIPGHLNSIGFGCSRKYDGEEKQAALDWLSRCFGITDRESLFDFCQNASTAI